MTSDLAYTIGYAEGQIALVKAMILNCDADIETLEGAKSEYLRNRLFKKAHEWEGRIVAFETLRDRLMQAKIRLINNRNAV
jgi:hypothetical protein